MGEMEELPLEQFSFENNGPFDLIFKSCVIFNYWQQKISPR
jgi:hypothetical protein